jgi:hypothetical protein
VNRNRLSLRAKLKEEGVRGSAKDFKWTRIGRCSGGRAGGALTKKTEPGGGWEEWWMEEDQRAFP